jgi:2-(1,2-epoxy-1,2-dihydrophenyl)acetyl-CoA isomerase
VTDLVRRDTEAGVALLTLNRPEKLNATTDEMTGALSAHLRAATTDDEVSSIVLTGAGKAFCAGGDLDRLMTPDERPLAATVAFTRRLMDIPELLHSSPKPSVAAVNGACAGAGLSWACAADIRIAGESAVFTTAFLRAGRAGDYGLAWTLPRIVGDGQARRMLLLGARVTAAEALRIGLVSAVVPDDELLDAARAAAGTIAGWSAPAVAALKANLVDAASMDLGPYLDREAERHIRTARTPEAAEAVTALVEKRTPRLRPTAATT